MKSLRLVNVLLLLSVILWCLSCGGDSEEEMVIAESCSDGIRNQDETGVDCGGVCDLCGPPSDGYYFYGVLDGEELVYKGLNGFGYIPRGGCGQISEAFNSGTWVEGIVAGTAGVSVGFTKYDGGNTVSSNFLYDMIEERSYDYTPLDPDNPFGCQDTRTLAEVRWDDGQGNIWLSSGGDQTGSTFEVTFKETGVTGTTSIQVDGTFTCKVYLLGGSGEKTIESGSFSMELALF